MGVANFPEVLKWNNSKERNGLRSLGNILRRLGEEREEERFLPSSNRTRHWTQCLKGHLVVAGEGCGWVWLQLLIVITIIHMYVNVHTQFKGN